MTLPAPLFTHHDVEIVQSENLYDGYFRLRRYHLRHRLFAGGHSDIFTREMFERGHAVGVLLYDPRHDKVALIEQFRAGALIADHSNAQNPVAARSPWLLECVAGVIDAGETPEMVAIRETREEAGTEIGRLEFICNYLSSPGAVAESVTLYCAEINSQHIAGLHGKADEHEDIKLHLLTAETAIAGLRQNYYGNAVTIIALQWLALNRPWLQEKWRV